MTLISNHFDLLYFTNCNLDRPLIRDSKIVIPTRQLGLLPNHPLNPQNEITFLPKSNFRWSQNIGTPINRICRRASRLP